MNVCIGLQGLCVLDQANAMFASVGLRSAGKPVQALEDSRVLQEALWSQTSGKTYAENSGAKQSLRKNSPGKRGRWVYVFDCNSETLLMS